MRNRAFRPIAAILSILLFTGTRVYAGPVVISEVIQVLGSYQNTPELRLRSASPTSSQVDSRIGSAARPENGSKIVDGFTADIFGENLLLGEVPTSIDEPPGVDVVATGDIEGTICDCGEITVPVGGFPKWPLLFLGAIPLLFIHDCNDCEQSTPTPTPPPTSTPEPASLLLLGSGLTAFGAELRRRYARGKATTNNAEEG